MPSHLAVAACLLLTVSQADPGHAADYSAWSGSADLTLNTGPGPNLLETPVTAYPLLVRLRAPGFPFAQAKAKGQDLRFSTPAGAPLAHEIETWDSAGGRADVWVRVDTVKANNATQSLRMFWGNPAAADSSRPGSVFPGDDGLIAAWHLGGPAAGARPNAVPQGNPAMPMGFEGDEGRRGLIGNCDSLGADATGDYLDVGSGYADWTPGLTYLAWVKPSAVRTWGRLMDFGNGMESDNIIIGRDAGTDNLAVHVYPGVGPDHSRLNSGAFFTLNQWQHVAVVIHARDSAVHAYRNGQLAWTSKLTAPIRVIERAQNWLGRSHWAVDQYWQGSYDEVRLHRASLGLARIRLDYISQREGSNLVTLVPHANCQARFAAAADTTVEEGAAVVLRGTAECGVDWSWARVSGAPVLIVDPASNDLAFRAPRVLRDTQVTFLFRARMPSGEAKDSVRVAIRATIPEPAFTLPDTVRFSGADSLVLQPAFSNLAAVRSSPDSVVRMTWTLEGLELDTAWRGFGLRLARPAANGIAQVTACADNDGPAHCETLTVIAGTGPTALRSPGHPPEGRAYRQGKSSPRRLDGRLDGRPSGRGLRPTP